jgi:hypothetical protein
VRTTAEVLLFAHGISLEGFARFHGCSRTWVSDVLRGKARAPERFRRDFEALIGVPFPDPMQNGDAS